MIVTYHGELFLKFQTGDTVIAVNPIAKDSGKKVTRFGADIALLSNNLPTCSGVAEVTLGNKDPFVISGPGEYERNGIMFKGVETRFTYEGVEKVNTAYTFLFDGIRVCVLGAVQEKLSGEVRDALGECDMLILPVLEGESLNYLSPHAAEAVAVALEAKVVIPVGHNDKTLPIFLKEAGATSVQPLEKLTIKKKEVDSKSGEVVTLQEI